MQVTTMDEATWVDSRFCLKAFQAMYVDIQSSFCFCIPQVIKNWMMGRPRNEASLVHSLLDAGCVVPTMVYYMITYS